MAGTCLATGLTSCRQNKKQSYRDEKNREVEAEYYSDGSVRNAFTYLNRERTEYIYVAYNSDGRLVDSARYINDTVEGVRKVYESSLGLLHIEHYSRGILDGPHKAVYDNRITSFEGFRRNGQKVGEWLFHYPDGRMITYEYYDSLGNIRYLRKYDETGSYLKASGYPLIRIEASGDTVTQNDTLRVLIEVATPPECVTSVRIAGMAGSAITGLPAEVSFTHPVKSISLPCPSAGLQKMMFEAVLDCTGQAPVTDRREVNVFVEPNSL
ncbi:MAG: hypothetical protein JW861_06390 [Bacteroidales bacterium]|nr:hypothetical protein [Bacteroidales bacterium]